MWRTDTPDDSVRDVVICQAVTTLILLHRHRVGSDYWIREGDDLWHKWDPDWLWFDVGALGFPDEEGEE